MLMNICLHNSCLTFSFVGETTIKIKITCVEKSFY